MTLLNNSFLVRIPTAILIVGVAGWQVLAQQGVTQPTATQATLSPSAVSQPVTPPDKKVDREQIASLLGNHCADCHAGGQQEGQFSLDVLLHAGSDAKAKEQWYRVARQLRLGLMPPPEHASISNGERGTILRWLSSDALQLDPNKPDPGKVTVRRLNRNEYRNTIRDLLGAEFDTALHFPADDTGHGFDNMADVLSISPLLLEKYVDAANAIIGSTVPVEPLVFQEQFIPGNRFRLATKSEASGKSQAIQESQLPNRYGLNDFDSTLMLSYYEPAIATASVELEHSGDYQIKFEMVAMETYVDNVFDLNQCECKFSLGGEVLLQQTFGRQNGREYTFAFERRLDKGSHQIQIEVRPTTQEKQVRQLRMRIKSVRLIGPKSDQFKVKPPNYERFFPRPVPVDVVERKAYARELLGQLASKAFRRPVDERTLDRLVALAEQSYSAPNRSFEFGIAKAMTATIASVGFLFREEQTLPVQGDEHPRLDDYSLASRLSYFLWSTMPDQELIALADSGRVREQLEIQTQRMLADHRGQQFFENFVGQWLQARTVSSIQINARAVLRRETAGSQASIDTERKRMFELFRINPRSDAEEAELQEILKRRESKVELNEPIRRAMRRETEMVFAYIVREDRSLLELLDSDYTFLNEALAGYYGIPDVKGDNMRLVKLDTSSPRGGVLTQGTTLVVTSNPDRTSPVKRGLFVLENLLGIPTPAPPPDVPSLEDSIQKASKRQLSLRESLAIHRENPVCSSCHNRMDPIGLALENFNALGRYREQEFGQSIDVAGKLVTGESFNNIRDLKRVLVSERRGDFYRCFTEKLMTYALGREVNYTDMPTIDSIVDRLEATGGKPSEAILGIIRSDAFQRRRAEANLVE